MGSPAGCWTLRERKSCSDFVLVCRSTTACAAPSSGIEIRLPDYLRVDSIFCDEDSDVISHSHPSQSVIQSPQGLSKSSRTAVDSQTFKKCPTPYHAEPDSLAEGRHTPQIKQMPVTGEDVLD